MLVYGKNVAISYLKKNKNIKKIIIQKGFSDKKIESLLLKYRNIIKIVDKNEIDKIEKGNHQGIILDVEDYKYSLIDEMNIENDNCILIILDHIEDTHNLGAIIRTCEASGVDGIIIPKDRSVDINSTVVKTSAGTVDEVKIAKVSNIKNTIDSLKKIGFWIVGTDMANAIDYRSIDFKGKIGIVIGNEGKGMSDIVKKSCDFIASIPMYGTVNSLNASVATALIIYEAINQQRG